MFWSLVRGEHTNGISIKFLSGAAGAGEPQPPPGTLGNLLTESGISDDALDSLIALKDFSGVVGLPPLELIEDQDPERERKAMRREIERRRQEELDRSRVKRVDEFGRAYATGKRKTSIARVWLAEGVGKFVVNGKSHDLYFPDIDNRVQLLEPFSETNTLGVFDVRSTVKGGGTSGTISFSLSVQVVVVDLFLQELGLNPCGRYLNLNQVRES